MNTPFDRSYWVEDGRLLAGFYPGGTSTAQTSEKLGQLLDAGIRSFINLTEEGESGTVAGLLRSYQAALRDLAEERDLDVAYTRIPVRDLDVPTFKTMDLILGVIDCSISNGQPVYVHCLGGIGRTGTVVGCHLKRKHGLSGEEVLRRIEALRTRDAHAHKPSPERPCQVEMLMNYGRQ